MAKIKLKIDKQRQNYFQWWKKVDDIVSGQKERICTSKYLVPFQTEVTNEARQKGVFQNRLKRTYPAVMSPGIIEQHKGQLAQKLAVEGFEGPTAEAIVNNVDGWGSTSQNKFSERLWHYLKDGQVGTLVEAPEEVADNLLESQLRGERSYQVLYEAKDILKVEYFTQGPRKGTIKDLYLRESDRTNGKKVYERVRRYYFDSVMGEDGEELMSSTYSVQILEREKNQNETLSEQQEFEYEYLIVEELSGSLETIPFTICGDGPADSVLYMVVDLDIALVNRISVLSNINYYQGFKLIFLFGVTDQEAVKEIGESRIQTFSSEGSLATSDAGDPAAVEREIEGLKSHIRRVAFKQHNAILSDTTRQVQSAESRAKDLIALENYYNDLLDMFIRKEQEIYQNHAIFEGLSPESIVVDAQRDFGLGDPEIARADEAMLYNNANQIVGEAGLEIKREVVKNQIDRMDIPYEVKAELKLKVDESEFANPFTAPRAASSPRVLETLRRQRQALITDANGAAA